MKIPRCAQKAEHALDLLFTWVLDNGGAITGEHGVGLAKKRWIGQALGAVSLDVHAPSNARSTAGICSTPGSSFEPISPIIVAAATMIGEDPAADEAPGRMPGPRYEARLMDQARMPDTTCAGSTPVGFWLRPWKRKVKRLWSMPRQWRMVALRSRMWTGFSTML